MLVIERITSAQLYFQPDLSLATPQKCRNDGFMKHPWITTSLSRSPDESPAVCAIPCRYRPLAAIDGLQRERGPKQYTHI